jgi:hypothetical protein
MPASGIDPISQSFLILAAREGIDPQAHVWFHRNSQAFCSDPV